MTINPELQRQSMLGPEGHAALGKRAERLNKALDNFRTQNPELAKEAETLVTEYTALWNRNAMLMNMPDSGELVSKNVERMSELFDRANAILGKMSAFTVKDRLKIDAAADTRGILEERIDALFTVEGDKVNTKSANTELKRLARGIAFDPNTLSSTTNSLNNIFYNRLSKDSSRISVNFGAISQAEQYLDSLSKTPIAQVRPGQQELIAQMKSAIEAIRRIDPNNNVTYLVNKEIERKAGKTDTRPIQVLVAAGGAAITTFGVLIGLKTGNFTWPTAFWAFITASALGKMPNPLKSSAMNTLEGMRMQDLNAPPLHNAVTAGLKGKQGVAALEEFLALRKNGTKLVKLKALLQQQQGVSTLQIATLVGEEAELTKVMAKMKSDSERSRVLKIMNSLSNPNEIALFKEYILMRAEPLPTASVDPGAFGGVTA